MFAAPFTSENDGGGGGKEKRGGDGRREGTPGGRGKPRTTIFLDIHYSRIIFGRTSSAIREFCISRIYIPF